MESGRAARSAARAAARAADPAATPAASDEKTGEVPELENDPADEKPTTANEKPAAVLPLVEQVARIKEQLGIEAATLPEAVKQANDVMGLAGGGALPAQVEALIAALGLGEQSEQAQPSAAASAPAATSPAKAAGKSPSKSSPLSRGAAAKKRFSPTPLKTDAGDKDDDAAVEVGQGRTGSTSESRRAARATRDEAKGAGEGGELGGKSGQGGKGGPAPVPTPTPTPVPTPTPTPGKRGSLFGRFKGKGAAKPESPSKAVASEERAEGAEAAEGAGSGEGGGGEGGAGAAAAVTTTLTASVHAVTLASTAKLPRLSKPLAKAAALQLSMRVLGHTARATPSALAKPLGTGGGTASLQAVLAPLNHLQPACKLRITDRITRTLCIEAPAP